MKNLLLLSALLSSLYSADLSVKITGVLNNTGLISIGLYNKPEGFREYESIFIGQEIKAKLGEMHYVFKDIPEGTYALSIFHDENEDKVLNKNFLGIPKEGYGFSNNIRPTFRAANFEESQFEVSKDTQLNIKMRY